MARRHGEELISQITHILPYAVVRRQRLLPREGRVVVRQGQPVRATDVVATAVLMAMATPGTAKLTSEQSWDQSNQTMPYKPVDYQFKDAVPHRPSDDEHRDALPSRPSNDDYRAALP